MNYDYKIRREKRYRENDNSDGYQRNDLLKMIFLIIIQNITITLMYKKYNFITTVRIH